MKIRFQLRGKGVAEEAITTALAEVEPEKAQAKLDKILQAKARTLEGDPQFKLKLLKFALSRGYEYETVEKAIKRMVGP